MHTYKNAPSQAPEMLPMQGGKHWRANNATAAQYWLSASKHLIVLACIYKRSNITHETPESALRDVINEQAGKHPDDEAEEHAEAYGVYALVGHCVAFFLNKPGRIRLISFAHGVGMPLNFHWLIACGVMSPRALAIAVGPSNAAITRTASWSICFKLLIFY